MVINNRKERHPVMTALEPVMLEKGVKFPRLAYLLGLKKDNLYKYNAGKADPPRTTVAILEKWIKENTIPRQIDSIRHLVENMEDDTDAPYGNTMPPSYSGIPAVDVLIEELRQQNKFLRNQVEQNNLNREIIYAVKEIRADVKAGHEYQAVKDAGNDKEAYARLMDFFSELAAKHLSSNTHPNTPN